VLLPAAKAGALTATAVCIQRATRYLGHPVGPDTLRDFNLHLVRSVAPKKDMYCLSFRLPKEVVFDEKPASP
jgi:tRNA (guanine37-N1)-methyltransferase